MHTDILVFLLSAAATLSLPVSLTSSRQAGWQITLLQDTAALGTTTRVPESGRYPTYLPTYQPTYLPTYPQATQLKRLGALSRRVCADAHEHTSLDTANRTSITATEWRRTAPHLAMPRAVRAVH